MYYLLTIKTNYDLDLYFNSLLCKFKSLPRVSCFFFARLPRNSLFFPRLEIALSQHLSLLMFSFRTISFSRLLLRYRYNSYRLVTRFSSHRTWEYKIYIYFHVCVFYLPTSVYDIHNICRDQYFNIIILALLSLIDCRQC